MVTSPCGPPCAVQGFLRYPKRDVIQNLSRIGEMLIARDVSLPKAVVDSTDDLVPARRRAGSCSYRGRSSPSKSVSEGRERPPAGLSS